MVHNHNVVVVLELGIFKLYPDMVGESLGPDDGADPEAGVLGLQLGDAGVDGGGVVEDVLLVWQPGCTCVIRARSLGLYLLWAGGDC